VPDDIVERAAAFAGLRLVEGMVDQLGRLASWLVAEALPAGGIGPREAGAVSGRHVADSLVLARAWRDRAAPGRILDLGTGAGLPALPLAVTHPASEVVAVDRAHRRVLLARRGARVLGTTNVRVVEADFARVEGTFEAVVARAAAHPEDLLPHMRRLTAPGGVAVVAASRTGRVEAEGFAGIEVPAAVLDRPVWLLIMAPS
jgi:16S rRNA (guanine527-N7)-methyltransferase